MTQTLTHTTFLLVELVQFTAANHYIREKKISQYQKICLAFQRDTYMFIGCCDKF